MSIPHSKLRGLIEDNCLLTGGEFILSTGAKSDYYFDCKRITLMGEGLALIAELMLTEIDTLAVKPTAIGGLTMGADFITAAVIMQAFQSGHQVLRGSIARKEPKQHGTRKTIENELPTGTPIVVVDDVITSGGSILKACHEFEAEDYKVVGVIAVVDREVGGIDKLRDHYSHVTALYKTSDFAKLKKYQQLADDKAAAA